MTTYPVKVSGIAPSTSTVQLQDFFSFCGAIHSIEHAEKSDTATVKYERPSAIDTALMLNGSTLDGATLTVTSDVKESVRPTATEGSGGIDQSDKPRAAIAAEYLAKGYTLSDKILERAIEIDHKQGISQRFLQYFQQLDQGIGQRAFGAEQKVSSTVQAKVDEQIKQAKAIDEQKGFSKIAHDYYQRAISSPLGQRVLSFYTETSKQVLDIHEEARRIAEEEKNKPTAQGSQVTPSATQAAEGSQAAPSATSEKAPTVV